MDVDDNFIQETTNVLAFEARYYIKTKESSVRRLLSPYAFSAKSYKLDHQTSYFVVS